MTLFSKNFLDNKNESLNEEFKGDKAVLIYRKLTNKRRRLKKQQKHSTKQKWIYKAYDYANRHNKTKFWDEECIGGVCMHHKCEAKLREDLDLLLGAMFK